jgi:hypothetical protein
MRPVGIIPPSRVGAASEFRSAVEASTDIRRAPWFGPGGADFSRLQTSQPSGTVSLVSLDRLVECDRAAEANDS